MTSSRRLSLDERALFGPPKKSEPVDFGLFETPDIRTPVPVAPGSATSELAAKAIDGPFRRKSWRLVMLALGSAARPLSREELSERTGIKECSLCGRLDELRPEWIEAVEGACVAVSGKVVDGYRLTSAGRERLKGAA